MPNECNRPSDLPVFTSPPLNEVVLGVQFTPARGYQQIMAGEVWSLFRPDFPLVEEHPPLPPAFETFGPSAAFTPFSIGMLAGAPHNRFFFISPDRDQLIQFQQDRLLHNWRKVGDHGNKYPRFETMSQLFEQEIVKLEIYFNSLESQLILCNQVEISYINQFISESDKAEDVSYFVNFVKFDHLLLEDFKISLRDTIIGPEKAPVGRLYCDLHSTPSAGGGRTYYLNLTARGTPYNPSKEAALDFLRLVHRIIVNKFVSITTERAQEGWGRTQ
jgi:uncharacterized protein (TIGR04255 family)